MPQSDLVSTAFGRAIVTVVKQCLARIRGHLVRRVQQCIGATQQGDAGFGRRIDSTSRIAGLKLAMAVFADDIPAKILDANLKLPTTCRTFLNEVCRPCHNGISLLRRHKKRFP